MKLLNEDVKASKTFLNSWVTLNKSLGDMEDKFAEAGDKKGMELDGFSNMIKYD